MTAPYPTGDRAEEVAETSVGELIGNISNDLSPLFRQEVELAKAEVKPEASRRARPPECSARPGSPAISPSSCSASPSSSH